MKIVEKTGYEAVIMHTKTPFRVHETVIITRKMRFSGYETVITTRKTWFSGYETVIITKKCGFPVMRRLSSSKNAIFGDETEPMIAVGA